MHFLTKVLNFSLTSLIFSSLSYSQEQLIVYTYDSFMAKGGIGETLIPIFEKKTGCIAKFISVGDAGSILTRLKIEKKQKKIKAHLVIGIDQYLWSQGQDLFEKWDEKKWTPTDYSKIKKETVIENGFLPFDYGIFTLIADTKRLGDLKISAPKNLKDLIKPEYKRKILIQDPRLSTPGLGFLINLKLSIVNTEFSSYLKKFRGQWLTLTSGWDQAYSLFLKEEAPLVWSYTTSEAYHRENEKEESKKTRYQALELEDGHILQVEGAAMVKNIQNTPLKECAQKLLSTLITKEVQAQIPLKNWMLPVRADIELPQSFKKIIQPKKIISIPKQFDSKKIVLEWQKEIESI